jgi:hypothetical protein
LATDSDVTLRPAASTVARSHWERAARLAWMVLAAGIALRLCFAIEHNNVYLKVFAPAPDAFFAGRELYELSGGFRYPPMCAVQLWPFAACGPLLGSILWRAVNLAVLLHGVRAVFAAPLPAPFSSRQRALFLAVLVVATIASLNLGQANPLLLGCCLSATAGVLAGRTLMPAAAITLATVCKVYPLAFGMVLATLRPRLAAWLGIGLLLAAGLPYLLQTSAYVNEQYRQLYEHLAAEDRTQDFANAYRDLRLVTAALGLPMPHLLFVALQLLGGLAIVVGCQLRRRRGESFAVVCTFACAATLCWFLLLGPATEKATYQLLGPALAWSLLQAEAGRHRGRLALMLLAVALVLLDNVIAPARETQASSPWLRCLSPWAAVLVAVDLLLQSLPQRGEESLARR